MTAPPLVVVHGAGQGAIKERPNPWATTGIVQLQRFGKRGSGAQTWIRSAGTDLEWDLQLGFVSIGAS